MPNQKKNLITESYPDDVQARAFCDAFINEPKNRFVFGRNAWAKSIAEHVDLDGFVDDFTSELSFCGKPIISSSALPDGAKVVSAVVLGRPLTALARIAERKAMGLDYFAFQKYSGLALPEVTFLGEFQREFNENRAFYESFYARLSDEESRHTLTRLINFRLSRDIRYMNGFIDAQDRQYFEPFLELADAGETFVDIGCFDGYTTEEFIRRCPQYQSVHVFEPEPSNMENVLLRLGKERNIRYHPYGASNEPAILRFASGGSSSRVSESGELTIEVKRIDDVINEPYTFLKMDIEGAEIPALLGASKTIKRFHPRLAISVYHKVDDIRRVAELVLSYRDDYKLYLRHYTEGVTETVLFFIPTQEGSEH